MKPMRLSAAAMQSSSLIVLRLYHISGLNADGTHPGDTSDEDDTEQMPLDEITLPVFIQWWHGHMRFLKRQMLKTVNELFLV